MTSHSLRRGMIFGVLLALGMCSSAAVPAYAMARYPSEAAPSCKGDTPSTFYQSGMIERHGWTVVKVLAGQDLYKLALPLASDSDELWVVDDRSGAYRMMWFAHGCLVKESRADVAEFATAYAEAFPRPVVSRPGAGTTEAVAGADEPAPSGESCSPVVQRFEGEAFTLYARAVATLYGIDLSHGPDPADALYVVQVPGARGTCSTVVMLYRRGEFVTAKDVPTVQHWHVLAWMRKHGWSI